MKNSSPSTAAVVIVTFLIMAAAAANAECSQQILTSPRILPSHVSNSLIYFPPTTPQGRLHHHQPPLPARNGGDEIDPRYGVEKRLVPSGPNPLHN
ncbi:CLAVATA3/ESR-RELATED 13 [Perilla frutescens var. hirtella]|nr:CLAVATA3/ESR-RELATED 13 [Perilla frutescens var. hirtella]KAH6807737.1 CLAVATA3/ESR-RELATED 13 [Perilla frutescens var. frutescens]